MKRLAGIVLGWCAALAAAGAAEPRPSTATPPAVAPAAPAISYVVAHTKIELRYGNDQIGELPEGTHVTVLREAGEWALVRADFGDAWISGWVRAALLAPDSLAKVEIEIARPELVYSYERRTLPGYQFLILRVRYSATKESPRRVYLDWSDEATANIYVVYNRDRKALPYGYMRREPEPGTARRTFDAVAKEQALELEPGKPTVETYVFSVPQRARGFELVLKDTRHPIHSR